MKVIVERGMRADVILAQAASHLSRSRVQSLIRAGAAELNGTPLTDPSRKVSPGDILTLAEPPPVPAAPAGEAIPLQVLYEDAALIVINKPAGLVVHPAAGHATGTLVNALIAHCGTSLSGIGGELRPGIVHRLDKETSGILVAAKSDVAHRGLAAQFADHGRTGPLKRVYDALAWGVLSSASGTIAKPIGRHPTDRQRFAVTGTGKPAVTHYRVTDTFNAASRLSLALETGRTHQIRVHLAHVGHPLLGDPLYGRGFVTKAAKLGPRAADALVRLGRQALHAGHLTFAHPITGATLSFDAPPPADHKALIDALACPTER